MNILERERKGETGVRGKRKVSTLGVKYGTKRKGLTAVIEELKQRILEKAAKIERYRDSIAQCRQNRVFAEEQKGI